MLKKMWNWNGRLRPAAGEIKIFENDGLQSNTIASQLLKVSGK